MKGKTSNKLLVIVAVLMLVAVTVLPGIAGLRANAAGNKYTAITCDDLTTGDPLHVPLSKVLDTPADASIPACGFAFTIVPGTPIAASTGNYEVKAGPFSANNAYPQIDDLIFAANTAKDTNTVTGTVTSCTKDTYVDFSDVEFTEPGVYRYFITEGNAANYSNIGIGMDEYNLRVLDIYIIDDGGVLKYDSAVMTKYNTSTETPGAPSLSGGASANKSTMFINKYPTNTLTISKTVEGNQGSKDEYFKFTIKLSDNATAGVTVDSQLNFSITGQDRNDDTDTANDIQANDATAYSVHDMETANDVDTLTGSQLLAGYDIYLQHGDVVTISGLVENCNFEITEAKGDYTVETVTSKAVGGSVDGTSETVSGVLDENTLVAFTNTKTGLIPTGVVLSVVPWVIAGLVIVGGIVFFAIRSKKKYDEQ